jgi:acyl-coenzyme A thioesterase PaaI-like protein
VLSAVGFEPLSVTTNLSINFLRKPAPRDLLAEARMLKLGKALAVTDIVIRSDGQSDIVAHAVVTYSIPPRKPQPRPAIANRASPHRSDTP